MEQRRSLLKAAAVGGVAMVLPAAQVAQAQGNPKEARPQEGDRFVLSEGDKKGAAVKLDDLKPGGPPVTVFPQDAKDGTVRDGSRLNQVLMVRLDESQLKNDTKSRAAQGVVAYSAVCTHTGCDGLSWDAGKAMFKCPCHETEFDATDGARVVAGPAPRRLPALPLKIVEGYVTAAGAFTSRAGVIQT
jgi:rieske iron-sulfur protein